MAEFVKEINEDLTQEELDTLYGIGLLGIAEQEEAEAIVTEVQAQLPELNPKQSELGLQFATKLLGEDYEIPNYKLAEIQSQILDWNIFRNNIDYDEASELAMYASEAKEEIDADGAIDEIDYDEMVYRGVCATRQLAKRQMTWLRGWSSVQWLDSDKPGEALDSVIQVVSA